MHWRDNILPAWVLVLMLTGILGACSSSPVYLSKDGFSITEIQVNTNGALQAGQPFTADVCKGFLLDEQQVSVFFIHANFVPEQPHEMPLDILPCYASGHALINGIPYQWVIRAGGVGRFTSKQYSFVKICGMECCGKVQSIC